MGTSSSKLGFPWKSSISWADRNRRRHMLPRFRKLDEGKTHRKLGKSNPNFLMGQGLAFLQIFPRKNGHFFDPGISSLPHRATPYCCAACGWCGNASRGRSCRPRISRARRSSAMLWMSSWSQTSPWIRRSSGKSRVEPKVIWCNYFDYFTSVTQVCTIYIFFYSIHAHTIIYILILIWTHVINR